MQRSKLLASAGGVLAMIIILLLPQTSVSSAAKNGAKAKQEPLVHESGAQSADAQAAERIWEQAIAAKGGRERLYAVRSMLISSTVDYITHKGKKNQLRRVNLDVFPNKYWNYEDYGSDVFGATMLMLNYDDGTKYFGAPGNPETRLEPLQERSRSNALDNAAIALLLENRWIKPVLIKARTETIGSTKADVVETIINGRRVDFAFDQQTHLPIQVSFYDVGRDKTYVNVQRFSDYVEVDGIKVPQTYMYSGEIPEFRGTIDKAVIKFNVDYDPEIFVKPPTKAGPEAWKVRK